jgi:hypothetical protein
LTPAVAKIAEPRSGSWSAPEVAWRIDYPVEVMDEIRAHACNGQSRFSNGRAEVGGVLYGLQGSGSIRIAAWRPIDSEYSDGEFLPLSHSDRLNLAVQLEAARRNPELKHLRPVGWFVSHRQGEVAMTSQDLQVHADFFPEMSQVTLVIRPTAGGRAEAGFFAREADGSVRLDASYRNFFLEPSSPRTEPAPVPQAGPALPSKPPSVPGPSVSPLALDPPIFKSLEPLPARGRWVWAIPIPIALALGLAAWFLYQRQKPAEGSSMAFRISSIGARTAQLEWDPNSSAVRDSERGEIDITDDGRNSEVLLSSDQLRSGKMVYLPQSGDVKFRLTVYPASGAPVHEIMRLIAPAFSSAQPEPAAPSAGQDQLQIQIRQLKEALRKERARADDLQNLNRILEDRLGIPPEEPKPAP